MRRCGPVRHPATLAAIAAVLLLIPLRSLGNSPGALAPVKLRIYGKEVALKTSALYDGREVYIPLEALSALKSTWVMTRREESVIVTPASGGSIEVALARPGREPMIPLSALSKHLRLPFETRDGVCEIGAEAKRTDAAVQQAPIKDPVKEPARDVSKELRAQMPPDGAAKAAPPHAPPSQAARTVGAGVQGSQPVDGAGSRPVVTPPVPPQEGEIERELKLNLPPTGSPQALIPTAQPGIQASAPAAFIQEVSFELVDDKFARLLVKYTGKTAISTRMLREPYRLAIDFSKSALVSAQREWVVEHPLFSALHLVQGDDISTSRLVVDLTKLVGYSPNDETPGLLTVNLMLPRGAGKRIQGRTIVIDAGHGGHQTGTSGSVNGVKVFEKNLTLDIAKRFHRLCAEAGIDVLMTRTSDAFVDLGERPALANKNNADLFISIHIDDCQLANSASGSTAYYHMNDASSRALAFSIVERIGQVSGLPVRGAWSDSRLYKKVGLAVLRGSRVPATLVEIGYMNNTIDRGKLMDSEYRQLIAQAMFDGIKGYIQGDLPDDTGITTDSD